MSTVVTMSYEAMGRDLITITAKEFERDNLSQRIY